MKGCGRSCKDRPAASRLRSDTHRHQRLAQLCLNLALLVIIEAALYGAFLWAHGPSQQFVQRYEVEEKQ